MDDDGTDDGAMRLGPAVSDSDSDSRVEGRGSKILFIYYDSVTILRISRRAIFYIVNESLMTTESGD